MCPVWSDDAHPRRLSSYSCLTLAARGESLAAFDERCIPASGVAPPSNTPGILSRRALPAGRLARLGATPDFHHGLPGACPRKMNTLLAGEQGHSLNREAAA